MQVSTASLLVLSVFFCEVLLSESVVEVTTPKGKIIGTDTSRTRNGRRILSFTGVPFAEPPIGALRFKEPQPLAAWKEPIDATKNGSVCPQISTFGPSAGAPYAGDENCLFLSVYTPTLDASKKLPVMVFIHGGGFAIGSGDIYGPEFLLDKDIVLVTPNYRLGIFGFATTGDDAIPGNIGLKDQTMALKWVHENIEGFGGDPNSVTVFGESAGGASAHFAILTPLNKGLVHRSISMSGTALCPWALSPLQLIKDRTKAVSTIAGCPTEPSNELLKCMQEVHTEVLLNAALKFQDWVLSPVVIFGPVIEPESGKGAFITKDPSAMESKIPWITGVSSGEGGIIASVLQSASVKHQTELKEHPGYIIPKLLTLRSSHAKSDIPTVTKRVLSFYLGDDPIDKNTTQDLIDLSTDGLFLNCAIDGVARHSGDAWLYYYDYLQSVSYNQIFGRGDVTGVCHSDILLNLFPIGYFFPKRTMTKKDIEESNKLIEIWTEFAKNGKPSAASSLKWEPTGKGSAANQKYLYIGDKIEQREKLLQLRTDFWNSILDLSLRRKSA